MNIFEDIKVLLSKIVKNHEIKTDSVLKDLGVDSLELLSLVVDIEKKYSITFEDDELMKLEKVSDVIDAIEKKKK